MDPLVWSEHAKEIFDKVIGSLPQFHRSIAQQLVKESAQEIASAKEKAAVEEDDLIEAFFKEVPPAFTDMMKRLFDRLHVDYSRYVND